MNILVYGAGVLGSVYAARLQTVGHMVTLLARGERLAQLRKHGIVLQEATTKRITTTHVAVVDHLDPKDAYDLVIVLLRKNQVSTILPSLAANRHTPNVLFMHNNAAGPVDLIEALGSDRVLLGFPAAGGTRDGHVVHYHILPAWQQATTVGEVDGRSTPRARQFAVMFAAAGFPAAVSRHMDAWLKTHVAFIDPVALAIYAAGGDVYRLAATPDALLLMIRAIKEGFAVLGALNIPVTPFNLNLKALQYMPDPLLGRVLPRLFATETADLVMARHANTARDEIAQLVTEFCALARSASLPTPALDQLSIYLDPSIPPMAKGSAELSINWRSLYVGAGALVGLLVSLRLLRPHRARNDRR